MYLRYRAVNRPCEYGAGSSEMLRNLARSSQRTFGEGLMAQRIFWVNVR
jgi:hypothetical protein